MDLNLLIDDADMILIGLGSEFKKECDLKFESEKDRLACFDSLAKRLEGKNYFFITSLEQDIVKGSNIKETKTVNPVITGEDKQFTYYNNWLAASLNKKLLIIELGEDFLRPNLMRWPFERIVMINQKSHLVRVSSKFAQLPEDIGDRAFSISLSPLDYLENELISK